MNNPSERDRRHRLVILGALLTQAPLVPAIAVQTTASATLGVVLLALEALACLAIGAQAAGIRPSSRRSRGMVVFSLLLSGAMGALAIVVARDRNFQSEMSYQLRVDPELCTVNASGYMPSTFYRLLEKTLDENPGVRALVISGPGGSTYRIVDAARLLAAHGVDTAVSLGHCASSCAFLWLAAPKRFVVGQPPLFHAPEVFGERQEEVQEEQMNYLLGKVPQPFLNRAWLRHGANAFWAPSVEEMRAYGVSATAVSESSLLERSFCR